ncbi:MAG: hypothetical protein GY774_16540 [Planctomycetes bacterium]|nr:hypothetical protein [Planctomycetota bacterium]
MTLIAKKVFDWEAFNKLKEDKGLTFDQQRELIVAAATEHFTKRAKQPLKFEQYVVDKVAGADVNLMGAKPVFLVSFSPDEPDRGYEAIFREFNMRASTNRTFNLLNVTGGVTYQQIEPGEQAEMTIVPASTLTPVTGLRFIGGYTVLDDWLKFNEYYMIEQLTEEAEDSWWDDKATIFYNLMVALGAGINVAFDTSIAKTINKAIVEIIAALVAKGVRRVNSNSSFVITCNEADRFVILEALTATFATPNTNRTPVIYNIKAVVPTTKIASGNFYVSLPDGKNGRGEWEDFNARPAQRDELKLGADHVSTGMYNAIIAEEDQHRRCATS